MSPKAIFAEIFPFSNSPNKGAQPFCLFCQRDECRQRGKVEGGCRLNCKLQTKTDLLRQGAP